MNRAIFREYDIRGIVGKDLTVELVQRLGQAVGTYLRRRDRCWINVGWDCRASSRPFRDALTSGLTSAGMAVTDIGMCPTPVFYFSLFHLNRDGGVMITGSHNPSEYNGFKICDGKDTIYGEQIQEVCRVMEGEHFERGEGSVEERAIIPDYQRYLIERIRLQRPIRLVVDAGNGNAGNVAPEIYRALGCAVTELYTEPDGRFPNHHPDPTVPENLRELIETVRRERAEVGIAFDGDADRIGAVDDRGNIIWGDQLLILYAREILREKPGAIIISEVKGSKTLFQDIARQGGRPLMYRTGHSLIKAKMKETGAVLAGEMSGHMFFADRYFGFDDAIYASCRLLEILSKTDQPISQMLADLPKTYSTPEIRVNCPDERKFQVVEDLKAEFRKDYEIIDLDGVRIVFPDGWGLIRASNTQPVLVLRYEADTEQRLQEIRDLVEARLRDVGGVRI